MTGTTGPRLHTLDAFKGEKGLTLVEAIVTVAVVGIAFVAFAVALSTGTLAVQESDQEVTVQGLAQTQMESIKGCDFVPGATTYPAVDTSDNYSVSVAVASVPGTDANIQKVTANILRDGQVLMTVEDYKVNR